MIRRIVFAALAAAALAPAAASAATQVRSLEDTILVTGDAAPNTIVITREAEYVVVAEAGATVADANDADDCEPHEGGRVRCDLNRGLGTMFVNAGEGDDTLTADAADLRIALGGEAGDDTLNSSADGEKTALAGGEGNDTLNARAGSLGSDDAGEAGNDTFNGNPAQPDAFEQEPGADTYSGGTRVFTQPACLEVCRDGDAMRYLAGPVSVTLDGTADDGAANEGDNVYADVDHVHGSPGDDVLDASVAPAGMTLSGRAGADTITGSPGHDDLEGGDGPDTISGLAGDDRIGSGGDEDEAPAADRLDGGEGDDSFNPGLGPDEIIGGPGIDDAVFFRFNAQSVPLGFEITLDGRPDDGQRGAGEGDNVHPDVEVVSTGGGDDVIVGSGGAEQISGGAGDDAIDGRGGVDILSGSFGADGIISRDLGFDVVNCGPGADPAVQGDEGDRLENCEAAALTPLPAPPDTVRPQLTLTGATSLSARAFRRVRGVSVTAKVNETSALLGEAVVRGKIARAGDLVIGEKALPLSNAGSRKLELRFSRRDVRAIQKRLRRRAFRLTLRVTATDAAGNRTTRTRRITIRKAPRKRR